MTDDFVDRELSPVLAVGEGDVDVSLRPRSLREFIGQPRVREQLQLVIEGAKNRGSTPDHILLSGPPASWVSSSAPRRPRKSPGARAERRVSPTGCCAGSATSRRCAPTG